MGRIAHPAGPFGGSLSRVGSARPVGRRGPAGHSRNSRHHAAPLKLAARTAASVTAAPASSAAIRPSRKT